MSDKLTGLIDQSVIEDDYGVLIDGNTGLITVDGAEVFDGTVFHPIIWYLRKLVNFPPLPVDVPTIIYPQDTNGDGYIDFDSVAKYDSTGTAYVILDIEYITPQLSGTNKYYLASNHLLNDVDITSKEYSVIGTQYNVPLDGSMNGLVVTTHAMIYNIGVNATESDTTTRSVQLVPKSYPYNFLVATPILDAEFTTICNTTVYINATAYDSYNKISYDSYLSVPSNRILTVDWVLVTSAGSTSILPSTSNPMAVQLTLDSSNQQNTILRCYFNKGTQWETHTDTTIKRTPADSQVTYIGFQLNKTTDNNTYVYGSKSTFSPAVDITNPQYQLAYFNNDGTVTKPKYPDNTDNYIVTWQNPTDTSTFTTLSRTVYTTSDDRETFTKIKDISLDAQSIEAPTSIKNLVIGSTYNLTDKTKTKGLPNITQIPYIPIQDIDKSAFVCTDYGITPLSFTNTIIYPTLSVSRTILVINTYSDTPQTTYLGFSDAISYNSGASISKSTGISYNVLNDTPQTTYLGIVLNTAYQSITTITRVKGISIGV